VKERERVMMMIRVSLVGAVAEVLDTFVAFGEEVSSQ